MSSRISQIKADVRFWFWKARTYHAQRYLSVITIIVTLGGLAFFYQQNGLFVQKAHAALGATYVGGVLNIDGGGKYMLMRDAGCGTGASLWPLDYVSSNNITNGAAPAFKGRLCIASGDTVTVQNGSTLSLVGQVTLGNLSVTGASKVTSAPADAHGKAAPYSSRPNFFTTRFTGFLALQPGHNYTLWPSANTDDETIIEIGTPVNGQSVDGATFLTSAGFLLVGRNGAGACNFDRSFRHTGEICGGVAGTLLPATFYNGANKLAFGNGGVNPIYMPIRVSSYEINGDAFVGLTWTDNGVQATVPVSSLYAPVETAGGLAPLGTADANNGQNKMRFEYGTGAIFAPPTQVARDLSNAAEYTFVSRVDLTQGGSFNGYGKQAFSATNNNNFNFFWWQNSDWQTAGSPLSNSQRDDSLGYLIGAAPNNGANVTLLQNYNLQTQGTNAAGINAGIYLTAANVVIAGASIDVNGKGLPGGVQFYPGFINRGVSGVGGRGQGTSPGWWMEVQGSGCDHSYAGHWDIHGGGGGGAGKCISPGPGGGGGGVIGYGSAGMATDINGNLSPLHTSAATDRVKNYGAGGGGYKGVGGGSNGNYTDYYANGTDSAYIHDRYNGSSNRGGYDPAIAPGMGGGGGQGSQGEDKDYTIYPAGAGGGIIQISVTGSLTMTNAATMDASGGTPPANISGYGVGAGGAGTVDVSVPNGSFDLSNDSLLIARGGSTPIEATPNNPDTAYAYPEGGLGGGGLIRVRAQTFGPAANSGWPSTLCDSVSEPFKAFFFTGGNPNLDARAGGRGVANIANAVSQAEDGLVDIAYYVTGKAGGSTFCGANVASSPDVQISKQIQQLNGSVNYSAGQWDTIITDTVAPTPRWNNVATAVAGSYIRVVITVRNPSSSQKVVRINDTLPIQIMTIEPAGNPQVKIIEDVGGNTNTASAVSANSINNLSLTMNPSSVYRIMYVSAVQSPF